MYIIKIILSFTYPFALFYYYAQQITIATSSLSAAEKDLRYFRRYAPDGFSSHSGINGLIAALQIARFHLPAIYPQ